MEKNGKPEVKMRKSGVFYVEAADIFNSESGLRQIQEAAEHAAAILKNRSKLRPSPNVAE